MIRINLLPVKISRRQEAVRSELVLAGVVAGLLAAGMGAAFVSVQSSVNTARAENAALQEEIRRVEEIAKDVQQKKELKAEFHRLLSHPAIMLRVIPEDAFCKGARSLPGPLQFPH